MAVDWLADVRIYAANADDKVVDAIVRYCGIALQSRDGQLVAMADKKERELVRENFLKKKLAITDPDSVLDDAIASVAERMKADRTKNRVTVYYLLAEQFGLLNVFGGVSGAAGGAGAAVAGLAAAGLGAVSGTASAATGAVGDAVSGVAGAATGAAAAVGGAVVGAAGAASDAVGGAVSGAANLASDAASGVAGVATGAAAAVGGAVAGAAGLASGAAGKLGDMASAPLSAVTSGYDDDGEGKGIWGWLKWLLLAALVLALLFWLLRSCSNQEATPVAGDATTETAATAETTETVEGAAAAAPAAPAAPVGSGVVAAERDGKPMLTVYFDTGKSDVSNDLTAAAAKVKAYVGSNAGAKLAVSGFNDPTGNAAINAELSKKRAQGVAKALEAVGIPAASIEMVKPADSTDTSGDNSAARRVEVTVQ